MKIMKANEGLLTGCILWVMLGGHRRMEDEGDAFWTNAEAP